MYLTIAHLDFISPTSKSKILRKWDTLERHPPLLSPISDLPLYCMSRHQRAEGEQCLGNRHPGTSWLNAGDE